MKAYLYCDKRSLNDATNYYVGIILNALTSKGFSCETTHEIREILKPTLIVTITSRYFLVAKTLFPFAKTIFWAQGVGFEEEKMRNAGIKSWPRLIVRRISEYVAVRCSSILLCVSNRMVEYFRKTYNYKRTDNYIVMPCFNLPLSSTFDILQYRKPSFVYTGNASKWQSIDFMLDVYAIVEKHIKDTTLTIYSREKDIFEKKLKSKGITKYDIKYVPTEILQEELHQYKYGFILRENHIVNNVSTPTKMNSYLASYVIPIFSDAVDDFKENIKLGEFTLMGKCPLNSNEMAKKIVTFESESLNYNDYYGYVKSIFDRHYNVTKYVPDIEEQIDRIIS